MTSATRRSSPGRAPAPGTLRIVGIDPGTQAMGYGFLEVRGEAIACLASGAIVVPRRLPLPERLRRLHVELSALLERYAPQEVAVEEPFVGKNPRAALNVGRAQAVALLAAAQRGLPVACYPPAKVKGAVAGHGASVKARVQQMVRLQLGLSEDPEPPDAADALAVALCHLQERRLSEILRRSR